MLLRTSPVPENESIPLFWNVFPAIVVVLGGVPMFSEKIVLAVPPPPDDMIVMVRLVLPTPTEFEAEMVTAVVPAVDGVPEMSPVAVSTKRFAGNPVAPKEIGLLVALMV